MTEENCSNNRLQQQQLQELSNVDMFPWQMGSANQTKLEFQDSLTKTLVSHLSSSNIA